MPDTSALAREKKFLDPKTLTKISRLDIIARLVVEGFVTGLHRSPYHGFSVEFAEHREYVPGDDIKHIDWKVYARSDRYYIKQYEEETNLTCTILVDGSESMKYRSDEALPSKLDYACYVAASLSYLILGGKARALLHGRHHVSTEDIAAVAKPVLRHRLITNFNAEAEGITTDKIIERLLEHVGAEKGEVAVTGGGGVAAGAKA